MTEIMTEDTPEDTVEMLKWKLERITHEFEKLNHEHRQQRDIAYASRQSDRDRILELEVRIEKLTNAMSVSDLRRAGVKVFLDFDGEED